MTLPRPTMDFNMTLHNPAGTPVPGNAPAADLTVTEEGARYALLQRLMPALQHQIMGNFQSMDMIAAMMERRLQPAGPDMASLREDCALLGSVSRAAVDSVVHLMAWVRPRPEATLKFDAGVAECTKVLLGELQFRGFAIVNEVAQVDALVSNRALRSVLSAALISLSDLSPVPASLVMRARVLPQRIDLSIDLIPTGQPTTNAASTTYRLLEWRDVETLAAAETVGLTRSDIGLRLSFARLADNSGMPITRLSGAQP